MKSIIPSEAAGIVREHKNYRRYAVVLACLAVIVALSTMLGLRLYGQAMTKEVRIFECAVAPHEHTDDCYAEVGGEKVLNCGQADHLVHTHNLDCYNDDGELVCSLVELKAHEHTADCWQTERVLACGLEEAAAPAPICGLEESAPHTHTDACYTVQDTYTCGQEEHTHTDACYTTASTLTCAEAEHTHTDTCYGEDGALTCTLPEHTHTDACYTAEQALTCGLAEHTHTDACRSSEKVLTCGLEETEGHTHTEACYPAADGAAEGHTHTDACYEERKTLICTEPEVILHTHSEECYTPVEELDKKTDEELKDMGLDRAALKIVEGAAGKPMALTCGKLEVLEHVHTEAAGCFHTERVAIADADEEQPAEGEAGSAPSAAPVLACGKAKHTHTEACYSFEKLPICGQEEGEAHTHTEACYYTEKVLTCGQDEHIHTDACYTVADGTAPDPDEPVDGSCYNAYGDVICGIEEHTHTEGCYAEDGTLTCELEEHIHIPPISDEIEEFTATREVDGLLVTATYDSTANIPANAEFRVVKIEPDGEDAEHYEQRMEAAQAAVENKKDDDDMLITPVVLLNIGFYLPDGTEVVPGSPVSIKVQFADTGEESPVAEGDTVNVVHFVDDETTDVLPGTDVDSDSATTFETTTFSDFAVTIGNYAFIDNTSGDTASGTGGVTEYNHNKRIDYLHDWGTNTDTKVDGERDTYNHDLITDDLYRLYLDMEGESKPVDLVIVIDRSNSMKEIMSGGRTRWQTVYDILEGTQSDGSDGLLYQFLKNNEGKTSNAEKNFVSVVWFAGEFKWRSIYNKYGSTTYTIPPNNSHEGGTVLAWTDTYTHQSTTNYTISPYIGDYTSCTNYIAGLWQADQKLHNLPEGTEGHRKVVVFISDGVPVYYYMAGDMNWTNPGSMNRYGGGSEIYTYADWTDSNLIKDYSGNHKAASFYKSPYFNETLKIFNGASNSFVTRNPNISFHTIAIDLEKEKINGWDRTTLLKDMAGSYTGGQMFNATDADGLKKFLQSIMFPAGVSIQDDLSAYVELYTHQPDIKVTATEKKNPSNVFSLWWFDGIDAFPADGGNITSNGKFNAEKFNNVSCDQIIDSITYDVKTRTITAKFKDDYCLGGDYIFTLSFDVQLTDAAYNAFARQGGAGEKGEKYPRQGDPDTDYPITHNETSSGKYGLPSNERASVTYTIKGSDGKENHGDLTYPHPVVQPWGTWFGLEKKALVGGEPLAGMSFKLLRDGKLVTPTGDISDREDKNHDGYFLTDTDGHLAYGLLENGSYVLTEFVKSGFVGADKEIRVATFEVYKGRIINMEPTEDLAEWTGASYDPKLDNNTPNTTYDDGEFKLIVTNERLGNRLKILKVDPQGNDLAGVGFTLINDDTGEPPELENDSKLYQPTGEDGVVFTGYLPEGDYTLIETSAPEGYQGDEKLVVKFHVDDGGNVGLLAPKSDLVKVETQETTGGQTIVTLTITNMPTPVEMRVRKVDSATHNPLANASFVLWRAQEGADGIWQALGTEPVWKGTSGEDGYLRGETAFPTLGYGKYLLHEAKAPDGYNILHEDIRIEVATDEDGKVIVRYSLTKNGGDWKTVAPTAEGSTRYYTFDVLNTSGYELPRTGGMGTQWYTLGGLLLAGIALLYKALAGRRRDRNRTAAR